jgi:hypothetical protein
MAKIAKDFEELSPETAVSTNVYRHVAGPKVKNTQCLPVL